MGGACGAWGDEMHKNLVGMPERKRQFEKSKRRSEENIKLSFREVKFESLDWIH